MNPKLLGLDRDIEAERLRRRYEQGEKISDLMAATGRSYGYVHGLLTHAHTQFRTRGFERGTRTGRGPVGSVPPMAFGRTRPDEWAPSKLTPQQRDDITRRLAEGEDVKALALEYQVSASTIRHHA